MYFVDSLVNHRQTYHIAHCSTLMPNHASFIIGIPLVQVHVDAPMYMYMYNRPSRYSLIVPRPLQLLSVARTMNSCLLAVQPQ